MAYMGMPCETGLRSLWRRARCVRDFLPVACVLCGERARGALCEVCRDAVCGSMTSQRRCERCDLRYEPGGPGAVRRRSTVDSGGHDAPSQQCDSESGVHEAPPHCPDCAALSPAFHRAVAAFDYDWPGELLVHRLKRERRFECAPVLAALMADRVWRDILCHEQVVRAVPECSLGASGGSGKAMGDATPVAQSKASATGGRAVASYTPPVPGAGRQQPVWVVPVPASRRALAVRGFNPAAEIGRDLALRLGLSWRPEVLRRVREGGFQKGLSRHERRAGVAGLYACAMPVAGRAMLVVDDVMTTGSTLHAVAGVLKAAGAARVWCAVAARTPLQRGECRSR